MGQKVGALKFYFYAVRHMSGQSLPPPCVFHRSLSGTGSRQKGHLWPFRTPSVRSSASICATSCPGVREMCEGAPWPLRVTTDERCLSYRDIVFVRALRRRRGSAIERLGLV